MFGPTAIALLLVALTCSSWAQTADALPDAPTIQSAGFVVSRNFRNSGEPVPAGIPPAFDRTFDAAAIGVLGSSIANVEMIMRCGPQACQAVPGGLRSRAGLYGVGIPAAVGISYLSHWLRRSGHRWWYLPMGLVTTGNVVYALHATQCTGDTCQYFSNPAHSSP
jgi:hypothetical protein